MKILIVDDSHATLEIVRRGLEKFGYRKLLIEKANNAKSALTLIGSWHPDIVLTDWHMPDMCGVTLLQQQLTEVTSSTKDHVTEKEQQLIDDLNKKLKRSHKLIRKLKGDLDKSVEKLKVTRQKLYAQYDAVTVLQEEKDQLQADYEALKTASESSDKTSNADASSTPDQTRLLNTLNEYKRQIAEQDQLLQQLQLQTDGPESSEELDTLKQELEKTQYALKHLTKEKKFIEGRYLEMMKNSQKPS